MKRVLALTCLIAALSVSASAGAAAGTAATPTERLGQLDQQVLAEVNRTRVAHGLQRLVISSGLQRAADAHSRQMLDLGFFAHDTPGGNTFGKRIRSYYPADGFTTWSAGENLLYGSVGITAEAAVKAWLRSPGHRENILSRTWREVGVASLRARVAGGAFGGRETLVVTMDFGARSGKSTASTLETTSRAAIEPVRNPSVSMAPTHLRLADFFAKPKHPTAVRGTRNQAVLRFLPGGRASQLT
jgi:uncharacterized protein YkwD